MGEPVTTISLDDLGDLDGGLTQPFRSHGSDSFDTDFSSAGAISSQATNASSPFPSDLNTVPESINIATGTNARSGVTRMTELFGSLSTNAGSRRRLFVVAAVLFVVGAFVLMLLGDVSSHLLDQFLGDEPEAQIVTHAEPKVAPLPSEPIEQKSAALPVPEPAAEDLQNPYWNLPNPLEGGPQLAPRGVMTLGTEETWKAGLQGSKSLRYDTYLRYKTIQDMRQSRLKGSESLFTDALNQPKFWARMEALFGLAELGTPPDVDTVQNAIGNTRRALVKNYFKRFRARANLAELYVMRQAIRVVDAGARLVILDVLSKQSDPANTLYFYAASFDPNPQIQTWYRENSKRFMISEEQKNQFKRYASGQEAPPPARRAMEAATPAKPVEPALQDMKVEELPHDVDVEEVYFLNEDEASKETPENVEVEEIEDGFETLKSEQP